jgi:hypothetical protein
VVPLSAPGVVGPDPIDGTVPLGPALYGVAAAGPEAAFGGATSSGTPDGAPVAAAGGGMLGTGAGVETGVAGFAASPGVVTPGAACWANAGRAAQLSAATKKILRMGLSPYCAETTSPARTGLPPD